MANRVMDQKRRKMLRHRMQGAKKVFPSSYNNRVKVSQGPDIRIGEYYKRTKTLGNPFQDHPPAEPKPEIQLDDPVLQMEFKRLFQVDRMQKVHEYNNLRIDGQETRRIKYYFGGGEHFFVQELELMGETIRRRSIIYKSKEQAMLYYNIPHGIVWECAQVVRTRSPQ
jgi:hypothetical protein